MFELKVYRISKSLELHNLDSFFFREGNGSKEYEYLNPFSRIPFKYSNFLVKWNKVDELVGFI